MKYWMEESFWTFYWVSKRCGEWDADTRIDVKKVIGEFSYNPLYIREVDVSNEYIDYLTNFERIDKFEEKWSTMTIGGP